MDGPSTPPPTHVTLRVYAAQGAPVCSRPPPHCTSSTPLSLPRSFPQLRAHPLPRGGLRRHLRQRERARRACLAAQHPPKLVALPHGAARSLRRGGKRASRRQAGNRHGRGSAHSRVVVVIVVFLLLGVQRGWVLRGRRRRQRAGRRLCPGPCPGVPGARRGGPALPAGRILRHGRARARRRHPGTPSPSLHSTFVCWLLIVCVSCCRKRAATKTCVCCPRRRRRCHGRPRAAATATAPPTPPLQPTAIGKG